MLKLSNLARFIPVDYILSLVRTPLYRNAYVLTFGAIMTASLGMVYWFVAARYYPTQVVGLNSALMSATLLLSSVSGLYLDGTLFRFIPRAGHASGRLIRYTYLISSVIAICTSLIFLLGVGIWSPALGFLQTSVWWVLSFVLANISSCILTLQDAALTGLRETKWIAIKNTLMAGAKVVLLIGFARLMPQYGIFASWIIPAALLLVPVDRLIFGRLLPEHQRTTGHLTVPIVRAQIVGYVAGNYIGYLFQTVSTTLLPLIVIQVAGSSANAHFYLPWIIASLIPLITVNMSTSLTVEGSRDQDQLMVYGRQALLHTIGLLVPVVAIVLLVAPYMLSLFGSSYANEGTPLLRLLALASIPNMVQVLYTSVARVQHKIAGVVLTQAATCIIGISLSYIFLRMYGITGIGLGRLVSQTIVAAVLLLTQLRGIVSPLRSA